MPQSPYKIGLAPNILGRAKLILGLLSLAFVILIIAGIHQGVVSGDFQRTVLQPYNQFIADIQATPSPVASLMPLPSSSASATPSPTATAVATKKPATVTQTARPVVANCISKNIREGEFASNKCYTTQDYEDLEYYLNKYTSATGSVSFYETKVNITCGNNDFHKTCDQDKKDQQANLDNIPRYRGIIQGIIARGK